MIIVRDMENGQTIKKGSPAEMFTELENEARRRQLNSIKKDLRKLEIQTEAAGRHIERAANPGKLVKLKSYALKKKLGSKLKKLIK